jgi:hypothetical protein
MADEPVEITHDGRWVAEVSIDPQMVNHTGFDGRAIFKMVIDEMVDSIFDVTRTPVDLKIEVKEILPGDYDGQFQEVRPGWRCRIEGEKRRPGRKAIE